VSASARTILLFVALLAAPLAQALGLGGLTGNGALGAPLDAYVPLYLAPGERATLQGVDVLPDAFARDDATPLAELVARIEGDASLTYVHVTSAAPLRVDRLRFRLRVNTTRGAIVGRYALRVASGPALPSSSTSLARRRSPMNGEARIVARSPASVVALAGEDRYGPVRRGESLWTIARRIAPADDPSSTMRALHALNPDAFIGGDMNRLRTDVTLVLPQGLSQAGADDAIATRDAAATSNTADTKAATGDGQARATPAVQAKDTDALDALLDEAAPTIASARDETMNDAATAARATTSPDDHVAETTHAPRDAALAQRVAELDAKFAAIRAKYGRAPSPALAASAPAASSPAAEVSRIDEAPAPQAAAPIEPLPAVTRVPAVKSPPTSASAADDGLPGWLLVGVAAGLVLATLLIALPRLKRASLARRTQSTVADVRAADAYRRAEVARKAENRVRLESEIQGLIQRKQATPPESEPPPAASAPLAETTAPPASPFEQTLDALAVTHGGGLIEKDRDVAIDANIAHGRYAEAEVLLREVIKDHPRNVQAKLRLAEVYYITEKLDGFAAVASDLKEHHRVDLSDDEWQRVVRMGKIVAPDLALFSGPKAVGKRA